MLTKIVLVLLIVSILMLIPIWPKQVKKGTIKVSTYTKIQLLTGRIYID